MCSRFVGYCFIVTQESLKSVPRALFVMRMLLAFRRLLYLKVWPPIANDFCYFTLHYRCRFRLTEQRKGNYANEFLMFAYTASCTLSFKPLHKTDVTKFLKNMKEMKQTLDADTSTQLFLILLFVIHMNEEQNKSLREKKNNAKTKSVTLIIQCAVWNESFLNLQLWEPMAVSRTAHFCTYT